MDHMGQAVGIDPDMAFDAGDQLAAIKPFLFRRVGIFDTLRVNDQKSCVGIPTKALSGLANRIFLKPLPAGSVRRCLWRSIFASSHSRCATLENQTAASAIGSHF
jgi:hypothetical protein